MKTRPILLIIFIFILIIGTLWAIAISSIHRSTASGSFMHTYLQMIMTPQEKKYEDALAKELTYQLEVAYKL